MIYESKALIRFYITPLRVQILKKARLQKMARPVCSWIFACYQIVDSILPERLMSTSTTAMS